MVEREIFFSVSMTRAIYIYIYILRERERERGREREGDDAVENLNLPSSSVQRFFVLCAPASKVRSEQELCFVQPSHIKEILEN